MSDLNKELRKSTTDVSEKEELRFIFQAAIAPISILLRLHEGIPFLTALAQTFDRAKYVEYLRQKQAPR